MTNDYAELFVFAEFFSQIGWETWDRPGNSAVEQ